MQMYALFLYRYLAITIDLLGANGIATYIIVMMGIPDQVIREIELSNGELCCLKLGYELSEFSELDILGGLNGIYCQYAYDCNCNKSERCQIRINEIISNLDSLQEKRAIKRYNGKWIARP